MKTLVYLGKRKMVLREAPYPDGEVVIKVIASGICGTDLKTYLRGNSMFKPSTILGHECYGEVTETVSGVKGINRGDLVAVAPYIECGKCDVCISGAPELCSNKTFLKTGCFSEYISMTEEHAKHALYKIEGGSHVFTLVEPLACIVNGIGRLKDKTGDVLIVGGGPMGALFALTLGRMGGKASIVETSSWRLDYLEKMNLKAFVPDKVGQMHYTSVVLAVNVPELVLKYLSRVEHGGKMLLFAGYPSGSVIEIDPHHVHYREVDIIGSFGNDRPVTGAGSYGEDYLNRPCHGIDVSSMSFSRALRFLLESFRRCKVDLVIGVGGDGTLSQIASGLLSLRWKVPLLGVAAGTANVGPLLRFSPKAFELADFGALSIEHVGAVEVLRESTGMGYAFVDVILGQTFLGAINGKTVNLCAEVFLSRHEKIVGCPAVNLTTPNFKIFKNGSEIAIKACDVAQIIVAPLHLKEFYIGKAITGVLCWAHYMNSAAAVGLSSRVLVDAEALFPEEAIEIKHILFSEGDEIVLEGISGNNCIIIDGNPVGYCNAPLLFRYLPDAQPCVVPQGGGLLPVCLEVDVAEA